LLRLFNFWISYLNLLDKLLQFQVI